MIQDAPQPWLIEVPARTITKTVREQWQDYTDDCANERGLVSPTVAAKLSGISRMRIYQLIDKKKLDVLEHFGHPWLSCAQLMQRLNDRPKAGRPIGS